jgi:hypothetical protein
VVYLLSSYNNRLLCDAQCSRNIKLQSTNIRFPELVQGKLQTSNFPGS